MSNYPYECSIVTVESIIKDYMLQRDIPIREAIAIAFISDILIWIRSHAIQENDFQLHLLTRITNTAQEIALEAKV